MAKKKLIIPKFASEAEDAGWHNRHRRKLESAVAHRIQEGSTLTMRRSETSTGLHNCAHVFVPAIEV